ncbi:Membrane protein involved in the export of O-antigen and teichoic acid [Leifsonia sp. 21MFCrub1.1]|nr:Membrane protein involved in the export of O-antigen and teichoic acid [Leifsonia sp. 21MFCrub1.1]
MVTWRVFVEIGAAGYGLFSVFWSALFLVVGILFGLQQEATRVVAHQRAAPLDPGSTRSIWRFAAVVSLVVGAVIMLLAPLWAVPSLGQDHSQLAWFVAVGAAMNGLVAATSGVLAGAAMWPHLAAIVALDGVLRLTFVLTVLSFTSDVTALAVAVILPFPVSLLVVGLAGGRRLIVSGQVSVAYRRLASNSARTMLAAGATAVLINGFPLFLSFFAGPQSHALLGSLVLAVTLTRAPVLVPLMALSSYLVSRFSHQPERAGRLAAVLLAGLAGLVGVLCLGTWLWGEPVLRWIFGPTFIITSGVLTALVASSGMIGALFVSGSLVLSRDRHGLYAAGWVVASLVSLGVLFFPLPLPERTALSLAAGPLIGLAIHLVGTAVLRSGRARTGLEVGAG